MKIKNSEILDEIILKLENNHLNLYHDVSKENINEYVKKLKTNIDSLDEVKFDYEILKLFALFKDGHTKYFTGKNIYLDHEFKYLNNKLYLKDGNKYLLIEKMNDIPVDLIIDKMKSLVSHETIEWLNYETSRRFNNGYFLKMIGVFDNNQAMVTCDNNINIFVKESETDLFNKNIFPYEYNFIRNDILYLRYSSCKNHPQYPFEKMIQELEEKLKSTRLKGYILDVRGNTGGDSKIIMPFLKLVLKSNLKGIVLIDNGVFSSGRFAVADFKKYANALLIGQSTGGAVSSYGYGKELSCCNKRFLCSIKFWDFSDIFPYRAL